MNLSTARRILVLGLPILIGQLGMIVTGFADTMMVGHYSTEALASASFVNNVFNTAILACIGFTYGLTPLAGALFSKGQRGDIGALVRNAAFSNLLFSLLIVAVMTVVYFNLDRLGQPVELLPVIRPYFLLYLAGIVPIAMFNVWAQWSYAVNDTRTPMWIILTANLINIALNWVLIYGNLGAPEMGLTGAGIATLVARVFCPVVLIGLFFTLKRLREYSAGFRSGHLTRNEIVKVNRTSWPVAMQMAFETGAFSGAAIMTGWLGAIPLAAFQIIVIIGTLGFCVYYSMAAAVSVLVSNAAGCSDHAAMKRIANTGYVIILTLAAIASVVFIAGGRHMMGLFTDDDTVLAVATSLIFPLVVYQLGDATQITFANALRGTSNVMPMLWIAFVSYVVIGLPATWLLGFPLGMGTFGIVLSFSVSLFIAAFLFLRQFRKTLRNNTIICKP